MIIKKSPSVVNSENITSEPETKYLPVHELRIHDLEKDNTSLKNELISLKKENKELIEENAVLRYLQEGKKKTSG
jgi:hypothetical protein